MAELAASDPVTTSRLTEVDRAIVRAESTLTAQLPRHAALLTSALGGLRGRLRAAHDTCGAVSGRAWSDYVTRLDRGLDELHVELDRAGDRPGTTPTPEDLVYLRATRLELDGWLLHFDVRAGADGDRTATDGLAQTVSRELDDFGRSCRARADAAKDGVERAMDDVRNAGTTPTA